MNVGRTKAVIDWDRIKTGSKVMIKPSGSVCGNTGTIDLSKPVDVVFFKTTHLISFLGKFHSKGNCDSYCTFYQDGEFVAFSAATNTDYITEVIEY